MRVPLSWLRELVPGLTADADEVAEALVRAGLEVEQVHKTGRDVTGVVVGEVLDVTELTEFKKPIRYCHVDVGARQHEVVCGATNFVPGDRIPFAVPGAVLPGDFRIATRQTYGHTSDGMICSAAELGLADSSDGILVLAPDSPLGADVVELLALRDEVLDIAVTPDRGYTLSVRGVAREVATAFGLPLADPGLLDPGDAPAGHGVRVEDPSACDRFVALTFTLDPTVPSPTWLQRRLALAGMRSISLAVDVTNAVMLELGQPLHAYDRERVAGDLVARRATAGERLVTLDGQDRALSPEDLVIADDSGAVGLAGVMGGAATEISASTTSVVLEAARFAPVVIARAARRHKLPSEASKRFERGIDPALAPAAAMSAYRLLASLGAASDLAGRTDVDLRGPSPVLAFPVGAPERLAGRPYDREVVLRRLRDVGCHVSGAEEVVEVTPPSWRPDLTGTAELVEEVVRLEGYDTIPVVLPAAPAGRGLTAVQRWRRTASRALASAGLVEVTTPPFVSEQVLEALGGGTESPRLLNPLSAEEALLRPTLLPGLLAALARNTGRGLHDVALFETGHVFLGTGSRPPSVPGVEGRPSAEALAALDAALPAQPRHAGLVLAGAPASWDTAVEAVLAVGRALALDLTVRQAAHGPFHPGRCAEVLLDGARVGLAGELHPRVVATLELPTRTCAAEVNLDVLVAAAAARGPVTAPSVSHYPPATVDVALVVADTVPAADVEAALRDGAGGLLEALRLFDVYTGPQVGQGARSLAYALRLRAADRTLTDVEVLGARDAAIAEAGRRTGAVLRS